MTSNITVSPVWSLSNTDKSSILNDNDGKFSMENCIYLKNNHESLNHITDISMWIEFTAPMLKKEEYTLTVTSSSRTIELYTTSAMNYHSTNKCKSSEENPQLFTCNTTFISEDGKFRLKFLSLKDPAKLKLELNSLSVESTKSSKATTSNLTPDGAHPQLQPSTFSIDSMFQSINKLIDSKLNPVLIRLEALEYSLLRNEKLIHTLIKDVSKSIDDSKNIDSSSNEKVDEDNNKITNEFPISNQSVD